MAGLLEINKMLKASYVNENVFMVKYYRKTIQNDTYERWMMGFCYDKLWKKLIDEKNE